MDLNEYQAAAAGTSRYGHDHTKLPYLGLALCGESAEFVQAVLDVGRKVEGTGDVTQELDELAVMLLRLEELGREAETLKKAIRRGDVPVRFRISPGEADRQKMILELGDILWYVAEAAGQLGVPLGDLAQANLSKLAKRREEAKLHERS